MSLRAHDRDKCHLGQDQSDGDVLPRDMTKTGSDVSLRAQETWIWEAKTRITAQTHDNPTYNLFA